MGNHVARGRALRQQRAESFGFMAHEGIAIIGDGCVKVGAKLAGKSAKDFRTQNVMHDSVASLPMARERPVNGKWRITRLLATHALSETG